MFRFDELKQIHLEITNNCQASCPMCSRNHHGGQKNPLIKINNWTLDDFKVIITQEVLNQIEGIYFCGNFGDPILNNDLIEMCRYIKDSSPTTSIRIHTNGSARPKSWWIDLVSALPINHRIVFALDGLEDTHHLYRIGTNFNTILKNAEVFISHGGRADWCFIKFQHNEHQVDQARDLASKMNFECFTVKNSSRFMGDPNFDVRDKDGNVLYYLKPPSNNTIKFIDRSVIENYKTIVKQSEIDCYVKENKEIYIDAYKKVFPCCWLASTPYNYTEPDSYIFNIRKEIENQYYELVRSLGGNDAVDATKNSLKNIINSEKYQNIWDYFWNDNKLITCARTCGRLPEQNISKPKDQFIEVLKL